MVQKEHTHTASLKIFIRFLHCYSQKSKLNQAACKPATCMHNGPSGFAHDHPTQPINIYVTDRNYV